MDDEKGRGLQECVLSWRGACLMILDLGYYLPLPDFFAQRFSIDISYLHVVVYLDT